MRGGAAAGRPGLRDPQYRAFAGWPQGLKSVAMVDDRKLGEEPNSSDEPNLLDEPNLVDEPNLFDRRLHARRPRSMLHLCCGRRFSLAQLLVPVAEWWRRLDSNQRPTDYETVALTSLSYAAYLLKGPEN